jgi:phage gpG-like protein
MPGYKLTTEVIGAKEMSEAFSKAPQVVSKNLQDAIAKTAFSVEGKAKSYAPIQYGNLRGSIHTEGPTVLTNNVEAIVGTNIQYALFQERGTGVYAGKGPIRPKTKKFWLGNKTDNGFLQDR